MTGEADNCAGAVTVTHVSDSPDPGCTGTVTRTYRLTDECGNTADITQTITILDNVAPTADPLPALGPYACYANIPAANIADVTGEADNCAGAVTVTHVSDSPDPGCTGTVTRTYRLTDECGNTADITQTITILDNVAPTADPLPALGPYACYANIPAANIADVTGEADNCAGAVTVTHVSDSPDPGCTGTVTRTYRLTDECGNTADITQTITILDNTDPVITLCPPDLSFCEVPSNSYTIPILTVTDNCSGSVDIRYQITGATDRNGTGNDASGIFNVGASTIVWTVIDACSNSSTCTTVITIEDNVTPTFTQLGPYCVGSIPVILPTTSINNITGTWNPSIITTNTVGSTAYTFTPTVGLCATTTTMDIVITPEVTPAFEAIAPICQNTTAPLLPTASTNTTPVTGTWNPASIATDVAGTFTFTFTPNDPTQCAIPVDIQITVLPEVTPTFDDIADICQNTAAPLLPTASTNTTPVTGTWNPASIATDVAGTFTFTFTPNDPTQCAIPVDIQITVLPEVTPTFDDIADICQNTAAPLLPTASTNTTPVTGTWNPASIATDVAGTFTFTFTPNDPTQCAIPVDIQITVLPEVTPTFDDIADICQNTVAPLLPTASNNTTPVTGTWNPASIATDVAGTFTFTFTPNDPTQCAIPVDIQITVLPEVTPTFDDIADICQNTTAPLLPTASNNNTPVTGTWNPASIATDVAGTFTFTFTPNDPTQCAIPVDIQITVLPEVTPTFDDIADICQNSTAPLLPTASTNNTPVTGTWNPASIATDVAGTFTFTFTPNDPTQCAIPVDIQITVLPEVTPTFDDIADICQNSTAPLLPTASNNTTPVIGTWNPASIATDVAGTFTFTFTPNDPTQCAIPVDIQITVLPEVTPTFDDIADICQNSTAPLLPTASTNNTPVTGTWNPASIATDVAGTFTFTFTPNDPTQCAIPVDIQITVLPEVTPTFDDIADICQNSTAPLLPTASTNNTPVTGTWNPASIATDVAGTFTFTFTPNDPTQCAIPVDIQITVLPEVTPTFDDIADICQNSTAPLLPTASTNNTPVTGTWNPASIATDVAGTFTFTFTPNDPTQCAIPVDIQITVLPEVTPTFDDIADICQNSTAPLLPASTNNTPVTGTWNPASIATDVAGTFTFTFTPNDPTQCAIPVDIQITVLPEVTPTFDDIADICQNSTAPLLPTASNNTTPVIRYLEPGFDCY